jgi:hypothetical protein
MELELLCPTSENHVMGHSLERYLRQRIHQDIANGEWSVIIVAGEIRRPPRATVATWEKSNKPLDFQRPTATVVDATTIQLNCVPSSSYLQHYASVVATYLLMIGKPNPVRCIAPPESDLSECLLRSNLPNLGPADVVLIGQDYRLLSMTDEPWPPPASSERDLFVWQKFQSPKGKTIALLGCKESFWGETSGLMIRLLQRTSGVKCVIYVSKAGSLAPAYRPNEWIATGEECVLGSEHIRWTNVLKDYLNYPIIATGKLVTVSSPLCETQEWLREWQKTCSWVDCETGHMAKATQDLGLDFGYLHVVSDNLGGRFEENLSNEDTEAVAGKREILYEDMVSILHSFVGSWDGLSSVL